MYLLPNLGDVKQVSNSLQFGIWIWTLF